MGQALIPRDFAHCSVKGFPCVPSSSRRRGTATSRERPARQITWPQPALRPDPRPGDPPDNPPERPCNSATVATYAAWKKLPEAFLRSLDLTDLRYHERPALRIPYFDRAGAEIAVRIRRCLDRDPIQDRRFVWRRGDKPQLYGLDRLGQPAFVVLVEGESDCYTLWYHDVPALGVPGAGTWNEARDARHLEGIARVYVVVEPDRGGEAVKHWLARSVIAERARLVDLAPFKDPSAMHCADPAAFKARFAAALENAVPFGRILAEDRARSTAEAWQACQALATHAVRLHPENETRLLSLTVTDTPEQTRAILRAIAERRVAAVDPGPWLALQHWLAHAEHRVVIPYASALAERIPPVAVRLRRDFGQLLALIHAHAILGCNLIACVPEGRLRSAVPLPRRRD